MILRIYNFYWIFVENIRGFNFINKKKIYKERIVEIGREFEPTNGMLFGAKGKTQPNDENIYCPI